MELAAPETDHFKLLEDKVLELIQRVNTLKTEKDACLKTIEDQKEQISGLNNELHDLREIKNKAKDRITSILAKIDELSI